MNREVERLLELAAQVPAQARGKLLARESPDPAARAEVMDLLRYADEAESFFDSAIQGTASALIVRLEPAAGTMVGSYRIVRELGRGGMGIVYLAERADGEIEQKVAIKLLRREGLRAGWRERFLKERQLLASLHHPSIVQVLDAGHTEDARPYLVMEYVAGRPIDGYAAQIGMRERLRLFMDVCDGVSHAHRHLIVHRDLKPSNILVDGQGRAKLLDFGIAKLLNDTGDVTQVADRLLTPNYASPEQLRGEVESTATDIYSLGAVLYKLVTGLGPRERGGAAPSRINGDVPADLDYVAGKALQAEPEERYGTVEELAGDVRAVLENRPVQARGGGVWYRTRRYARRYWAPVVAAGMVLASLTVGLWMVNRERKIADRERSVAERRFIDVRQLASKLFDIDVQVAQLSGGSQARQLIVDTALEYLRRVSVDVRMEPGLALELGTAYMRVARVQGVNISPNLGQTAQADRTEQVAQGLIDSVLAVQPANRIGLLRAGQIAHDRMILAANEGREDVALRFAETSVRRLDQFLATRPLDATADRVDAQQVIIALMNVANHFMRAGWFEKTRQTAQRAIDIAYATNWQPQAGAALIIVALSHRAAGGLDEALQAIHESVRLLTPDPEETRVGRLLPYSLALLREGQILGENDAINLHRPQEAIRCMERSLAIGDTLARRDSKDYSSQYRVFSSETRLAAILRDSNPARAAALYDDALRHLANMTANASALHDETGTLAASVYPLLHLGRRAEARKRLDRAMEHVHRLGLYPAAKIALGSPLDATLRALAEFDGVGGRPREAAARYEELLHGIEAGRPDSDTRLEDAVKLSSLYDAAAKMEYRAGRPGAAVGIEQQRLELWERWNTKLANNQFVRRQLESARFN